MQERSATKTGRHRLARFAGILAVIFTAAVLISALPSFTANAESQSSFLANFLGWTTSEQSSTEPQNYSAANNLLVTRTVCAAGCDLPTVAAAVAEVNAGVPAGGVTYNVAAGHTETAPAGGYTITATGTAADQIIFQKDPATMGANPTITASNAHVVGSLHDAVFEILGGDFITIAGFTMLENPANTVTTAASNTMTEWGVAVLYATTTDGAQNVTLQNNTIDLVRTYQNTFGIYSNSTHSATSITTTASATTTAGGNSGLKIYGNFITDVNIGIVVVGPTAAADHNDGLDIGGATNATTNTITDYGSTGTFSGYANVSGTVNGILVRNTKNYNVSFNNITSSAGGTTAGTLRGIFVPAFTNAPTGTITNTISNNFVSVRSGVVAGALQGIIVEGTSANATTTTNINSNILSNITHTVAAASGAITLISNAAIALNTNINGNTFENLTVSTTGSVTFISNSWTNPTAGGVKNVNNNSIVTAFNKTGAGGTVTLFTDNGSDVAGTFNNSNNNNFSNITVTGATSVIGWNNTNGGAPTKTVTGNTFSNWTGGTGAMSGLVVSFSGTSNVSNNLVSNITNGGSIFGIASASGTTENFSLNTVHTLTGTGTGAVVGMLNSAGTTKNFFRNKIYNLENNNAAGSVNGILVSGGTTVNVFNNLIGDLRTPAVSATNPLIGINVTSTTTVSNVNLSFNTVYLNATSSGANFGSSALFHTVSATATTASLTSRNNIFVNLSTPNGTGLTVAYRRSGTALDNYNAASNNNDFYAGTPSATRLIYYDGTNADQTLAQYKARVTPRDSNSVTENPNFLSTTGSSATFLHINPATPTQLESGGIPVSGITDDFDGNTRNASTPDIGADEFTGVPIDLSAPTITYTPLVNTTSTANRTISVTITDLSGIAGGANSPRIYFRKNGGAYFSTQCVFVSGNNYDCTIDYTLVGGATTNDVIDYFVVAQDVNGNVGSNPSAGFAATDVNNVTTPPTNPNTYTIVSGFTASANVGTGETYTSLTNNDAGGLFRALNSGVLTNNVTINITSDLTLETGAIALNQLVEEGATPGTYTVTIKPTGAARVISGTNATGALVRLNGADRVTIDGSTGGGTDRSLTITNNSTATNTAAIQISSLGAGAGATNNTVKNTNLSCGADQSTSTNVTYGISHGGALLGNSGADNDNNSFINNAITKVNIGIYSSGESAANQVQNTVISNNLIGPAAFGADQIGRAGIIFNLTNGATVTGNEVRFVGVLEAQTSSGGSYDKFGIAHAFNGWSETTFGDLAVSNTTIGANKVHDIVEENTFSAVGIFMAGGNGANDTLNKTVNNFIWNVRANGTLGDNSASLGIASGKGDTVAFNSIYMAGDLDPLLSSTSSTSSFGIQIPSTTVVNLTLKDNISFVDLTSNTATLKHGAIKIPASFVWGTGGSNYNDLYVPAANAQAIVGRVGTTDALTLADWQTASGQDANSKSVDPLFVSSTDLHLQATSTLIAMGTPIAGITTDIDGNTRDAVPDIGADEIVNFVAPTVQFSSATYTGAEGTSATITVTRSGDTTGESSVSYATSNGTATGGATCETGVDYVTTNGTINFAGGETSKTFNVQLCSDAIVKGDETINLTLSSPAGATLGTPSTSVLTITNVNAPVAGTLALSAATYTVGEAGSSVAVTINRTGGSDGEVSVNFGFTDGTATGGSSCAAGVDYNNTGGSVTFATGQTSQSFNVTICNDTLVEGNETFTITLSGATGGATIGTPSSAVVTITDDDVAQPGTLAFSSATYTVSESGGTATVTVNRTGGSDGSVTVDFATVAGGTATGGASCDAGIDYLNTSGTLTFAGGVTSQTFTVTICPDATPKANETINLMLSNATGGATVGVQNTAVLTITDDDTPPAGNVVVNPGNVAYMTLGEAVAAINAGTHSGAVTVDINASTTETGAIVLNGSGAGAASYTSIVIRPMNDGVTVAGPTVAGRGLIELNGADNVTIDGDNPNTGGTNRNLTLQNTAANTVNFTSVIRIALAATIINLADNDIFRNLNIVGNSTGRNIATATSTTGTENTTFGILAGPGASTVSTTTAPAAITSVSTGVGAGATATNLTVNNNSVVTAARAISINGSATSVFPGLQITNNLIGNPVAGEANQVTAIGITAQGSTNALISGNTVYVEGYVASSASTHGINVGVNSTAITGATIEKNRVNRVMNNNPSTWSAFGINLGGGNDHVVRNNFVSGVINNQTAGTGAFGSTFGAYGIRIAAGTGHDIYHNSVNLYGVMPGVTSTNLTAAFLIVATTQTGLDVRNNIFSNQITGGNPTGTRHVAIALPSAGTSAMNLTLNNNAYYQGTDANSRMAQVGTTFGTGEFLAENFDPTSTTPASNFRAYSSTLSAAGTNDNASFATSAPPPFVSNTDLHIPAGTPTRLESGGAAVGVVDDIDLETRNAATPDIGADEFVGNPPPANDIAAVSILVPVPNSTVTTGTTVSPQARFTNVGSAVQTNVSVQFTITGPGGYNYSDTQTIATINPGQPIIVTFAAAPAFTAVGTYNMTATVLTPDSNPANNQITGSFQVRAPVTGTITVGTGGDYTSLTNPGGIFADLNLLGASGNVVINIISDLTAETGAVPLNQLAGGFSVTIKPSGAARTISGTAPANTGLIILNGADNVTIDGSLSGGTDRSLTITNNQTGTSTVIWIRSASASNGSNNNTIKNCIINGATGATQTTAGILTGSGVTIGADAEAANSNNTIQNNWIYRVQNSMYLRGGLAAANFDQNWLVTGNEMGSTTAGNRNSFRGMLIGNSQNFTVSGNLIHGIQSSATTTASMSGIQIGLLVNGGVATNNIIHEIKNVSATGTGANGVHFITTSTASNVTVANNFVYDVTALGSATLASNGFGINVASGAGYKIYHNSVNLNTNQTSGTTAAMIVQSTVTAAGALDVRNNIFANTQTAGATRYAFYSGAANTVYSSIDFNDYFSTGSLGFLGGARATIEEWRTATGQDANSKAVDPLFVSPTDLHLQAGSPMINMGTTIAGITTDIDGQTRDATPDIGADEVVLTLPGTLSLSSATYSVPENGGTVTVTVNRTSGTVGAVSVDYMLANGTATGGAACGAGVDYINTGGTVNFAEGQASQTFTVQICDDAVFEGNETFTVTLVNPQGGAILGTPSAATVTIVENDPMPVVPSISINDVTVVEGDAGMSTATFTVTVTNPNSTAVTVQYATANGTATAGTDYVATSGTLTFNPGTTTQTINVTIIGDAIKEANETFFVNLSNPTNATITDGQGVGIIIDNDRAVIADFDGDRKSDFSVWRPADGYWYILPSTSQILNARQFGANGDKIVPGDYDGDGRTDLAVFRPSEGMWYIQRSSDFGFVAAQFGNSTDIPVQGDYNGDGRTDLAVFRPSTGVWYIARPTGVPNANFDSIQFGQSGDRPVQGDYDGDAKTDVAVYRNGNWYVLRSSDGAFVAQQFGLGSDVPVVGDFDGDGRTDFTVYRDNTWYILQSQTGAFRAVQFGTTGDIPMAADIDGDGRADITVFRPSNGFWYVLRSSDGAFVAQQWGQNADVPVPAAYQPR